MTVYVVVEIDFGTPFIQSIFDNIDSARAEQARLTDLNKKDWVSYSIQEWDVLK